MAAETNFPSTMMKIYGTQAGRTEVSKWLQILIGVLMPQGGGDQMMAVSNSSMIHSIQGPH